MPLNIRFTSQLEMRVVARVFPQGSLIEMLLPLHVWLQIGGVLITDHVEPVFYLDDPAPTPTGYLVRGAVESACEEGWTIYSDLLDHGVSPREAQAVLPLSTMIYGHYEADDVKLKAFVERHAETTIPELAVIADGFELILAEGTS